MSDSATKSMLGLCLREPSSLVICLNAGVAPGHFEERDEQRIFAAMMLAESEKRAFDMVALSPLLPDLTMLLVGLDEGAPVAQNVSFYAQEVLAQYWVRDTLRKIADLARTLGVREAFDPLGPLKDRVEALLEHAARGPETALGGSKTVREVQDHYFEGLEARMVSFQAGEVSGFPTGIENLNYALGGGWRRGRMATICARSGRGKTTMALNFMATAAFSGAKCCYYTVEMPDSQLYEKILAREARISVTSLQSGDLHEHDVDRLFHMAPKLAAAPMRIDDNWRGSIGKLKRDLKRLKRLGAIDLAFVDYAQQMRVSDNPRMSTREHITDATAELKQIALELDIGIILVAQMNRIADNSDEMPGIHLIADSSSIEKDSDQVLILHHYNDDESLLFLAKNRHGKDRVTIRLECDFTMGVFREKK